jgi:hypothetical protein
VNDMKTEYAAAQQRRLSVDQLVTDISRLPADWHLAGTMREPVLRAIARHCGKGGIARSVETGSGKTTLLFSHLSRDHKVFAKEGDNHSITVVRDSPLLERSTVKFIEGPTQITLPQHKFEQKLQLALLDGPHGYPFPELEYYYLYPHLETNAMLIVDDIHIPTINRLFDFLSEDEMFRLQEVVDTTAFFVRTEAPPFSPLGDGWWLQTYNTKRFPVGVPISLTQKLRRFASTRFPPPLKRMIKGVIQRKRFGKP